MGDTVPDDQAEQVGTQNSQSAADDGTDQALQVDDAQAGFKPEHDQPNQDPSSGGSPWGRTSQAKRLQVITGHGHNDNESKTNDKKVHTGPSKVGRLLAKAKKRET